MNTIKIIVDNDIHEIEVESGINLRNALLAFDFSPYTHITQKLNCGGRGLCATCGVWIESDIEPQHWHDKAAHTFGYPRLSCQITIDQDMTIQLLTDKMIWGQRNPDKAQLFKPKNVIDSD